MPIIFVNLEVKSSMNKVIVDIEVLGISLVATDKITVV